ncbi:uncharacterized protein EV420DRAFT_1480750 [Desarmillaria tabescens]|uniref:Uncharacterized protein n=1 Tax=Armillaria tabescens TaxID=1929756 RepID=A0AA39K9X3_ARMTA|nr:uncharacterized protein EV420DRAFT_1480750 [Desarmillaria tabescens]KAK0457274.1 hypothetical protein EV420DRAFT_1480750 [Desarmillaria tabescens]
MFNLAPTMIHPIDYGTHIAYNIPPSYSSQPYPVSAHGFGVASFTIRSCFVRLRHPSFLFMTHFGPSSSESVIGFTLLDEIFCQLESPTFSLEFLYGRCSGMPNRLSLVHVAAPGNAGQYLPCGFLQILHSLLSDIVIDQAQGRLKRISLPEQLRENTSSGSRGCYKSPERSDMTVRIQCHNDGNPLEESNVVGAGQWRTALPFYCGRLSSRFHLLSDSLLVAEVLEGIQRRVPNFSALFEAHVSRIWQISSVYFSYRLKFPGSSGYDALHYVYSSSLLDDTASIQEIWFSNYYGRTK